MAKALPPVRVLVVDDDQAILEFMETFLTKDGFEVTTLADPKDARLAWDVVIDPSAEPQEEPPELKLARLSKGATFQMERRRSLRS